MTNKLSRWLTIERDYEFVFITEYVQGAVKKYQFWQSVIYGPDFFTSGCLYLCSFTEHRFFVIDFVTSAVQTWEIKAV